MTLGCIIQARMGSSRLPGKVMMNIEDDKPVLYFVINQLQHCTSFDKIIVATTVLPEDDIIFEYCSLLGIDCFRGSSQNVLDRYYQCATKFSLSTIVRIPSDKPLIDPTIVDDVVEKFKANSYDYITNFLPSTVPSGTEVEIFSFQALKTAWENAELPSEKEHVTPYIYNHREKFKVFNVSYHKDLSHFRWAVDRNEDIILVRNIVANISKRPILTEDIIDLFNRQPKLLDINKNVISNEGILKSLKEDEEFLKSKCSN